VWISRSRERSRFSPACGPCGRTKSLPLRLVRRPQRLRFAAKALRPAFTCQGCPGAPARSDDLQVWIATAWKSRRPCWVPQPKSTPDNRPDSAGRNRHGGAPGGRGPGKRNGGAQPGGCATAPKQCRLQQHSSGSPPREWSSGAQSDQAAAAQRPGRRAAVRVARHVCCLDNAEAWIQPHWPKPHLPLV